MESRFRSEIIGKIEKNKAAVHNFQKSYLSWNKSRNSTILELEQIVKDVHKDQLAYNERSIFFKEMNVKSRILRIESDSVFGFFGSVGAAITDAVGAINYFGQAWNIDDYLGKLGTILDKEAEMTKPLYVARSSCFTSYRDVEVVVQRYYYKACGSVLNNIAESITEDVWPELKNVLCGGSITDIIKRVDEFFTKMSKADVFIKMHRAIEDYVNSNPVVLDAIESSAKASFDIFDAFTPDINFFGLKVNLMINGALMQMEQSEICRLQSLVNNPEACHSKLESKIRETIINLKNEAKQMKDLYKSLVTALGSTVVLY